MKKGILFFPFVFSLALTSCASNIRHEIGEYFLETTWEDGKSEFRILQLTDIHLADKDDIQTHLDFMDLTIKQANPDFIVITGDLFTFASQTTAQKLFKFIDSYGVDWTATIGNHDEQCYFNVDWLTGLLNSYSEHCKFIDHQDDDVQGNSNFAINVKKAGSVFEELIIMDSNRYYYGSYFGYDFFKENQIEWYKRLIKHSVDEFGCNDSLLFCHIPLPEIYDAWDEAKTGENGTELLYGERREDPCSPDFNSGFYTEIENLGHTKGMYFGHDHVNNFIINFRNKIHFGYGIKATDRIYYDEDMMGGRVIVLHDDHSLTYENIYHTYAELGR